MHNQLYSKVFQLKRHIKNLQTWGQEYYWRIKYVL
jgi:hypothetical protein